MNGINVAGQVKRFSFEMAYRVADAISRGERPDREELAAVRRHWHPTIDPYAAPMGQGDDTPAEVEPVGPSEADSAWWAGQTDGYHSPDSPADDGVTEAELAFLALMDDPAYGEAYRAEEVMSCGFALL